MSGDVERVPATEIAEWRAAARATQRRFPLEQPNGWVLGDGDAAAVLAAFDRLEPAPGVRLVVYRMQWGRDGHSVLRAIRDGDAPAAPEADGPPDGLPAMAAVTGDGSLRSYLQASVLSRELEDFEAIGHGTRWSHVTVLPGIEDLAAWMMMRPPPGDLAPTARRLDRGVGVSFLVEDPVGMRRLLRLHDAYEDGSYVARRDEELLAERPDGYVP